MRSQGARSVSRRAGRSQEPPAAPALGAREKIARAVVHRVLSRLRGGRLDLVETWSGERHAFGPSAAALQARVAVHSPRAYLDLARRRSVGMGEAYAAGLWSTEDLLEVARIGARDVGRLDGPRRRVAPLARPFQWLGSLPVLNTRGGARRNIAAHYDLGNQLFELFLDREAMMYSSAVFEHAGQTLEEAQIARLDRICDRLALGPEDHLLEIGTGWGGLAVHAATTRGCRVTTTTISREQRSYAEGRVGAAGVDHLVTVLGADYRDLAGRYDKLVSIEMIEAVGWQYFDRFFERCSELLEPDGLLFLQAITVDDRAYEAEKGTRSLATELIFPGGCLPSLEVIQRTLARRTDMRTLWLDDISPSYALTLRHWRERFAAARERLEELGYDEPFRRLWTLWLAISEAGFREARIRDLQLVIAKPRWLGEVPGGERIATRGRDARRAVATPPEDGVAARG
ncbi:MAG: class I SAM-dependent methyltransferase [Solirubrobacterales bacterium]